MLLIMIKSLRKSQLKKKEGDIVSDIEDDEEDSAEKKEEISSDILRLLQVSTYIYIYIYTCVCVKIFTYFSLSTAT